jgi:hypothetical protein
MVIFILFMELLAAHLPPCGPSSTFDINVMATPIIIKISIAP